MAVVYMSAERKSKLAISYIAKYLFNNLEQCEVFKSHEDDDVTYYEIPRHILNTYRILDSFIGFDEAVSAVGYDFMTMTQGDMLMYSDENFITSAEYRNRFIERVKKIGYAADKDFNTNKAYTRVRIEFPGAPAPSGIYVLQYIGCEALRDEETQPYVNEDMVRKIMLRILENGPDSVLMLS